MKKNDNKSDSEFLRQQAEERLKKKSLAQRGNLSELDSLKLIHELEVHQIELEMQNEELLVARSAAQEAAEKYRELYDFAPMGYCTLSEQGKINEINLYGASLLGKERLHLQGRKFDHSVSIDTKPAFFQFLQDVFSRKTKETCEVALMAKGNSTVLVHLTGISATNGEECLVSLTDITEREKTQGALLLSEKKYHALFENVQDVFYQIDLAGIIQEISPSIKHLAEFNRDEIIGTNVSDIYFSLDDRALFLDEIKKKGEVRDYELTLRTKSGEKRFTSINASLIFDADGKPNHIDGAIRDISDRKKMNEEVIKAKNELEKFFNLVPDLVAVASSDGHLKNLNPEWEKVLGYSVQELLSKPLESFIHPDDIASTRAEISRQLKGGKTISFINRYRHKDGSYRWLEWNATPALDNLLYAAARDITERKIAKQALTESEEKYRSLFENVQDVFYQIDLNGIIIDLSPSIKHFSEFNRDELIGTNVSGLYSNPDDRKILLKELYEKGKVGDYELILKTKSGKTKVVSMNTSLIFDVDGKPHHIDGSIRDISDRKLAEEKVREKDIQFRKLSSNLPDL
ncbi:MAG: PAS domain-containing protein, partial [Bacteroidota bacterium]